jgi:Uma2 family endonuclease
MLYFGKVVNMASSLRWTSADLKTLPDDGKRYEVIDGELYVSKQPHYYHQLVCVNVVALLNTWNSRTGLGQVNLAPGIIFSDDDDVAPDVIWISAARREIALGSDGKLHSAPELIIEVLSPGERNERRDREAKLKLYSRRGVQEYWIINWRLRHLEIYRREDAELRLVRTLNQDDVIESPLLEGFSCPVARLFDGF